MEHPNQARKSNGAGEVDLRRVSVARIDDYLLGGAHNFAVDRELAEQAVRLMPQLPRLVQTNRAFLGRAVRYLVECGVSQFIDLGSGLPTAGNAYDVAKRATSAARVVHVDADPMVVAHSRCMVEGPNSAIIQADLREPDSVLDDPTTRKLIDLNRPVGLLMLFVLDFVPYAEDLVALIARYRERMAPGSHLVVSHSTVDGGDDTFARAQELYRSYAIEIYPRTRGEVSSLLAGFELAEPGVVQVPHWRAVGSESSESGPAEDIDEQPEHAGAYAVVGRRP
ncbi:SAM-dependent methyltransferase [Kutzneria viridogrisea]|uniref:S-adenosyl methyltransferase n=2 Tax=Kutzneria TaxID=43356 RepID=W5WL18_9PSEU|nr:SAM-dependent methyltransferase [Kutzneria albida]AHI01909.1 hypothetical protein KALB_8552 [Kutzneria albida DSM 43870]MBA8929669.1 hypothetical protein [Kutzneria viridogrisea]